MLCIFCNYKLMLGFSKCASSACASTLGKTRQCVKCIQSRFFIMIDTLYDKIIILFVAPVKENNDRVIDLLFSLTIICVSYLFSLI